MTESQIDDIVNLKVSNHKLNEIIKEKLDSIKDKLKISFIGKLSTPKNLLLKQLTNIDFPSYNTEKRNRYCTVISEYEEGYPNYNFKYEIFVKCEGEMFPITDVESYLKDNVNQNIDKFEIYLPESKESKLKNCIIYNTPPIGYSDDLDKFIVEQCYKSCYLYVFVINKEESILEEEMKIIQLLMEKKNVIQLKFVIACSRELSREDYIKIEQHYDHKIKEICANFPGIIIVSGHGYWFFGKESGDNTNIMENKINDLQNFIRKNPSDEMISAAVKSYQLKTFSPVISTYVSNKGNIKRELQISVENIEKIVNFISGSVKSDELKKTISEFNKEIKSISLDKIYGSNYSTDK